MHQTAINEVHPELNSLCRVFPERAKQAVFPHLEAIGCQSAEILVKSREPLHWVYFPVDTLISTAHVMEDGSSFGISLTGNEGVVGSEVILRSRRAIGQSAVVQPGTVFRLPARQLMREIDRDEALRSIFLNYEKYLLAQIMHASACARLHHTLNRLSRLLLCILDRIPGNEIAMTQETIAAILGIRRESVSLAATQLQEEGRIEIHRGRLRVLDRAGLEAHCCECYSMMKKLKWDVSNRGSGAQQPAG